MPKRFTSVKFSNNKTALLWSIWANDVDILKKVLKTYDPNKVNLMPALSAANLLNRKKCKEILLEHNADQSYAKLHDLLQSYCLFFDSPPTFKTTKRLANNVLAEHKINSAVSIPAYGIGLVKQGLEDYYHSHHSMLGADYKLTKDLLADSLENHFSFTVFELQSVFEKIRTGKTTFANSGWQGNPGHIIGVIFHRNHLIVGDGLKNKIAIYDFKQSTIQQADVKALLSYPSGSAVHRDLISKITHNKKPRYQLATKTQGLNCAVFSPLSALEGLWYLLLKERSLSHEDAASCAKLTRNHFEQFMKQHIVEQIKSNSEARKLFPDLNDPFVIKNPLRVSIAFGLGLYLCIGLTTGVFTSSFALLGLAFGFSSSFLLSILVNKVKENSQKIEHLPKNRSISANTTDNKFKLDKNDPHYLNLHKKLPDKKSKTSLVTKNRGSKTHRP